METDNKNDGEIPSNDDGFMLVVDDESIMRKIAVNVLKSAGHEAIAVKGGVEAVDIFKQRHAEINLVLLDLLMPDKSGQETFFEMKEIKPDVKVLLVTGVKKDKRIQSLLDAGVKGYIEKPFKLSHLAKRVEEILVKDS
jgi:CheY-like chemotaxis protein